jgi:hypothetical protein
MDPTDPDPDAVRNTGTLLCAFRLAAFAHGCSQIPHMKPNDNHIRFILDKFTVIAKHIYNTVRTEVSSGIYDHTRRYSC